MKTAGEIREITASVGKRRRLFLEKVRHPEEIETVLKIIFDEIEAAASAGQRGVSVWFAGMEDLRDLDVGIVNDLTTTLNKKGFFADIRPGESWFIAWGTFKEPFNPH